MTAPAIRPASTVLVFRPEADGYAVFMVKRHHKSGFMAGAHVFPGGRVDEADADVPVLPQDRARCAGHWDDALTDEGAYAHAAAAVRELCEETGVLLAKDAAGQAAGPDVADLVFAAVKEGASFSAELSARGLFAAVDKLVPFAWWLTPEAEPKRYDTRFYVCEAPAGQAGDIDGHEVVQFDWFTPAQALSAYGTGEIALAPPTLVSLEDLRGVTQLDEVAARVERPVRMICPVIESSGGGMLLTLPGHARHPEGDALWPGERNCIVMTGPGKFASAWQD